MGGVVSVVTVALLMVAYGCLCFTENSVQLLLVC